MRGGVKRSRNGCANCKARKLKCDEAYPSCLRCVKKGIVCPGPGSASEYASIPHPHDSTSSTSQDIREDEALIINENDLDTLFLEIPFYERSRDASLLGTGREKPEDNETCGGDNGSDWHSLENTDLHTAFDCFSSQDSDSVRSLSPPVTRAVGSNTTPPRRQSTISTASERSRCLANGGLEISPFPCSQSQSTDTSPRLMIDYSSVLVEYYFKEVAGLFSCYDSHLNPFRTVISGAWNSSAPVYYVVQSMAAACLADVLPQWSIVGTQMRNKAVACVESQTDPNKIDTGSMLALVMLGLTASWHDANDLGHEAFNRAQSIIAPIASGNAAGPLCTKGNNLQFFREAMIYWQMLLSYVTDDGWETIFEVTKPHPGSTAEVQPDPYVPHPWTGVARKAQALVSEVGCLIRQGRLRTSTTAFAVDDSHAVKSLIKAKILESKLQALRFPVEDVILSPADQQTPVKHFLTIAEAYRLTGLLQLYHVFPNLLEGQLDTLGNISPPHRQSVLAMQLTRLAITILDLLHTIPVDSRTRCVQPFLLVAVTSELRISHEMLDSGNGDSLSIIDVLQARKFVLARLSTFEHVLPAKPIRRMIDIVTETWNRIDQGMLNVYWLDVMTEKGWETIMG